MEEEKYQQLKESLSNVVENQFETYEQVKYLFKRFVFLENGCIEMKDLWFEKDEIKKDSEYYSVIIKMLDLYLKYCIKRESFNAKSLSEEINNILNTSKYSGYYSNILQISKMFGLEEEYFSEIVCGLLCLGFKKESGINSTFIATIKEFILDERISKSRYSLSLKEIDYSYIDEIFLSNLNSVLAKILANGDEKEINILISSLKTPDQRISSVSTNFENENDEKKLDIAKAKNVKSPNSQKINPIINQESEQDNKTSSIPDKNSPSISPYKNEEKNIIIEPNESSNPQSNNDSNEPIEDFNNGGKENKIFIQNKYQEKSSIDNNPKIDNQIQEGNQPKNNDLASDQNDKNQEIKLNENNLNSSFELTEKLLESKVKHEEEGQNIEETSLDKKIENAVFNVFQRYSIYNNLLQQHSELINTLKENNLIERYKNEITEDKINIQKLMIQVDEMTAIIQYLLPANIINIKRKVLDVVVFSILKQNKNLFKLEDNYCPVKKFLEKWEDKLVKLSHDLSEDKKKRINDCIDLIKNEKLKQNTCTKFPLKCFNHDLDNIMKYFSLYKNECNDIVHLSKKALKYYLLPFNESMNPKIKDLLNAFMNEKNKNEDIKSDSKEKEDNITIEKEEGDSSYSQPIEIDLNTALDILLNDKFGRESYISGIENKLEEINSLRKEYLVKYTESKKKGVDKILNTCAKHLDLTNKDMLIFSEEEKSVIQSVLDKFNKKLMGLNKIINLFVNSKNDGKNNELLEEFFNKLNEIAEGELSFDQNNYLYICVNAERTKKRTALVHLTIKLRKYEAVNLFIKNTFNIMNNYYEREKDDILHRLNELQEQTTELIKEAKKNTKIKSANLIYRNMMFSKFKYFDLDFDTFISNIKSYVKSIDAKLNDDIINDQVTSYWIIKNNLAEFID